MDFIAWITSKHPGLSESGINAVLALREEGCTVPFISRYRKDRTGGLDEVAIFKIFDSKEEWDQCNDRRAFILKEIERQGLLTPELKERLKSTFDSDILEELYLPFKEKKRSKAALAKEAGLLPLADWIWDVATGKVIPEPNQTLTIWAYTYKNEEKGFKESFDCVQGASALLAERVSDRLDLREKLREDFLSRGQVRARKASKAKPNSKFEPYFDFHENISSLLKKENSHRFLAIRRGVAEEELKFELVLTPEDQNLEATLDSIEASFGIIPNTDCSEVAAHAAKQGLRSYIVPAVRNLILKKLKLVADQEALEVFSKNLRGVLLSAPLGAKRVLGVDPGLRTGCKLAVVSETGSFQIHGVLFLHQESSMNSCKETLKKIIEEHKIDAIAVGNGTGGREALHAIRKICSEIGVPNITIALTNEAGASVYSASDYARKELPDLDVTVRGAVSIARRLQDPLAELVKIEPKSIGVGQYQHDVHPARLKRALEFVMDSCVNSVGVNPNTASVPLLTRVAGIGEVLAKAVISHRERFGAFSTKSDLMKVDGLGDKTYQQAVGFMRIPDSKNVLDRTGIHPENADAVKGALAQFGIELEAVGTVELPDPLEKSLSQVVGPLTAKDILGELRSPGKNLRGEFEAFNYRSDIFKLEDFKPEMVAPGIVTNITNFGAFVDIGVHQDGLVHLSQLADHFVSDPHQVVKPGDRVMVRVISVDLEKNQIALSMRLNARVQGRKEPTESRELKPSGNRPNLKLADAEPKLRQPSGGPKPALRPATVKALKPAMQMRQKTPVTPAKPKTPFNNPFAALAGLKGNLKNDGN